MTPEERADRRRQCQREYVRQRRRTDPAFLEKERAANRERARVRWQDPDYRAKSNAARLKTHRRLKYGLTDAEYSHLLVEQDGLCAICYEEPATHVDHDHVTGEVRGILCRSCNLGIGHLRDDVELLRAAIEYLTPEVLRLVELP